MVEVELTILLVSFLQMKKKFIHNAEHYGQNKFDYAHKRLWHYSVKTKKKQFFEKFWTAKNKKNKNFNFLTALKKKIYLKQ